MSGQSIIFDDAAKYERWMGVWSQLLGLQFMDWLSPAKGQRWVDVGCGNRAFTEQILENCVPSEVQGLDPSDAQIEFAKKRSKAGLGVFQTGNAMDLPFHSDRFDVAVMALVVFFVPDPAKGVGEMKRVVRPEGLISAYVWDIYGGGLPTEPFHKELRAMNIEYPLPPSAEASKLDALEAIWFEAGLSKIKTNTIAVQRTFESFDDFWNISTQSPTLTSVLENWSPEELDRFKPLVARHLKTEANGQITCFGHANAIKGFV